MPPSKQELRSEETKQAIVTAAGQLFADRGYDAVTMREIAKKAGCSHTTIYLYFKDKETLLHQLSMEPLHLLQKTIESVLADKTLSSDERLISVSLEFIRFSLLHRNMYAIFFLAKASRVDAKESEHDIQRLRNHLFHLLGNAVRDSLELGEEDGDVLLAYTRIYFYNLHGIIGTYTNSTETFDMLMGRLSDTFQLAMEVMLSGFKQTVKGRKDR